MATRRGTAYLVNGVEKWLKQTHPPSSTFPEGVYHYTDNLDEAYEGESPPPWYAHKVTPVPVKVTQTIELF